MFSCLLNFAPILIDKLAIRHDCRDLHFHKKPRAPHQATHLLASGISLFLIMPALPATGRGGLPAHGVAGLAPILITY